jgi:hypothetical protein
MAVLYHDGSKFVSQLLTRDGQVTDVDSTIALFDIGPKGKEYVGKSKLDGNGYIVNLSDTSFSKICENIETAYFFGNDNLIYVAKDSMQSHIAIQNLRTKSVLFSHTNSNPLKSYEISWLNPNHNILLFNSFQRINLLAMKKTFYETTCLSGAGEVLWKTRFRPLYQIYGVIATTSDAQFVFMDSDDSTITLWSPRDGLLNFEAPGNSKRILLIK